MKYGLNDFSMTIIIAIIFIGLIISLNSGIAFVDYTIYRINSSDYELVEGRVIDFNYVDILPAKGSLDKGAIYYSRADVLFTLNGHDYVKCNLRILSDKQKDDTVLLAINGSKVRRGEPYTISFVEIIMIIWFFLSIIILILIQCFKRIKAKNDNMLSKVKNQKYIIESEEKNQKTIADKQEYILKVYAGISLDKENDNIKNFLRENEIYLNQACLWYIDSGIYIKDILINSSMDSVRNCVKATMDMRNNGMDADFYVIEQCNNYCYCCSKKGEKIFSYSKNIGLTNTVYFDFYDYIMDKMKQSGGGGKCL